MINFSSECLELLNPRTTLSRTFDTRDRSLLTDAVQEDVTLAIPPVYVLPLTEVQSLVVNVADGTVVALRSVVA